MTGHGPAVAGGDRKAFRAVVMAAWAGILLGLFIQIVTLGGRSAIGAIPAALPFLSAVAGSVAWSAIVCCGLAIGITVENYRPQITGLLGLIAAPAAWAAAKGAQRAVQTIGGAPVDAITATVLQVGAVKAIEYGLLGYVLGRLAARPRAGLGLHTALGFGFGVVFGAMIVGLNVVHANGPVPPAQMLGLVITEIIFPVGCAAVTYGAGRLAGAVGFPGPVSPAQPV
ncbi:MAG: hypothetical protein JOZ42_16035 [Acetobacteraceae bacterium]|nr:hypothetical protein [Acetobacteraceae bacterium]